MTTLAQKAHDITQATALSAESPRRWANIFAHVYCDLLSKADEDDLRNETELIGVQTKVLQRLAKYADADDEICLAETLRALCSRRPTTTRNELWFARVEQTLGLDDEDKTVLEP